MDFTCVFFGIIFTIAGIIFAFSKMYTRLNGWKYISQEEKEKIDIEPLCKNIGGMITLNGVIFLIKGFVEGFGNSVFVWAMIAWLVIAGLDVWYISKSKRYIKG